MNRTKRLVTAVLGPLMLVALTAGSASAAQWVKLPGAARASYVDADSAVKHGDTLTYWILEDATSKYFLWDPPLRANQAPPFAKYVTKYEVDLRTPRHYRWVLRVFYDGKGQKLGTEVNSSHEWWPVSGLGSDVDVALSLAKEGNPTETIPAPTSDR